MRLTVAFCKNQAMLVHNQAIGLNHMTPLNAVGTNLVGAAEERA